MPRIEYQYTVFEFQRSPLAPLRQEEFSTVRKDFENFLGDFLEEKETEFKKLKNPHRFNLKVFLLMAGVAVVSGFTGDYLEKIKHENFGLALDLLAVGLGFAIIMQPVQWLLSFMKSSGFSAYEKKAREYYSWHRTLAVAADDYENYLRMVSERNVSDFVVFCHEEM
jgi:hypothetical protein